MRRGCLLIAIAALYCLSMGCNEIQLDEKTKTLFKIRYKIELHYPRADMKVHIVDWYSTNMENSLLNFHDAKGVKHVYSGCYEIYPVKEIVTTETAERKVTAKNHEQTK